MKNRIPWFLPALVVVLALAVGWPAPGSHGGALHADVATKVAVWVIFFLQGLVLPTHEIIRGLTLWRKHLVIQAGIFLTPTLLAVVLLAFFGGELNPALRLGLIFLGILPTTISSAVVFTGRAHGHVALALCNSTLANLLGVLIVPAVASLVAKDTLGTVDVMGALRSIAWMILVPLFFGQLLHGKTWPWLRAHRHVVGEINTTLVLFIVYCTFAEAVEQRFWESCGPGELTRVILLTLALGLGAAVVALGMARAMGWPKADALAFFFCATQKTVAAGVPLAQSLFGHTPALLGLILLPLLCYCPLQFMLAAGAVALTGEKPAAAK